MKRLDLILASIQVLSLLQHVAGLKANLHWPCDIGCKFTNILAEEEVGPEHVLDSDLEAYADAVEDLILKLPFNQDLTRFAPEWKVSKAHLVPVLVHLAPLGNSSRIDNTQLNFLKVVGLLVRKTTEEGKKDLLIECALAAFEARPDTRDYDVDDTKVYKSLCGTTNLVETDGNDYADYAGESWTDVHQRPSRVSASEAELDYFREDNALHRFHSQWHRSDRGQRLPTDQASQRERFFYMHKQLLNRYIVERRVAGIGGVVPLSRAARSQRFSSRYTLNLQTDPFRSMVQYASNRDTCQFGGGSRQSLDGLEAECDRSINGLGSNIFTVGQRCGENYHGSGHMILARDCGANLRRQDEFGRQKSISAPLADPTVSARDPLFYRWHLEVDRKYDQFLARLGSHRIEAVRPPQGITVARVELQSRCPTNNVETYWERYDNNRFFRLQHQPYRFNIRLNNPNSFRGRVIVRIFLFLEEFVNSLMHPIEMDRFVQDLGGQATEEIVRSDTQSSLAMKPHDVCGWPSNLLLPKGRTAGSSRFRLVVFVNEVSDGRVNIGQTPVRGAQVFCGARPQDRIISDYRRREGFPFDLRWSFNRAEVINNQHRDFGNVTASIRIHNVGLLDRSGRCMANL